MTDPSLPPGYSQPPSDLNEFYPASEKENPFDDINEQGLIAASNENLPKYSQASESLRTEKDIIENGPSSTIPQFPASDTAAPPPKLPERKYNFSNAQFFKTSDRILDDIRNDPLFFLSAYKDDSELEDDSFGRGILPDSSLDYAERLNKFIINSQKRYQMLMLSTSVEYLNTNKVEALDDDKKLWVFNGIIVPKVQVKIPTSPIFHFKLKIKGKENAMKVKHKFYSFEDEQLFPEDKKDLILDESRIIAITSQYSTDEERYRSRVIENSLPTIIDAATYVCEKTGTLVRAEIYAPVLDYEDLKEFENEEIQLRVMSYASLLPESSQNINIPTTLECLHTLFRVLKGPLDNIDIEDNKTLKPQTSMVLNFNLNLELLTEKLFFRNISEELHPPKFRDLGEFAQIGVDYFTRALIEVMYCGLIYAPNPQEFFKARILFSPDLKEIFKVFNEPELPNQVQYWENWSDYLYSAAFTALSSCSYYSDTTIIDCYETLTRMNPDYIPEYFDALTFASTSRTGQDLQIYMTTLRSQGVIGYQELKSNYLKFGYNISDPEVANSLTDDQIIIAYKNSLVLCQSKYERTTFREALEKIGLYRESPAIKSFMDTEPLFDVSEAYDALETDPSVDDDVLITAYQLKAEDTGYHNSLYPRALLTVAIHRKSLMLINFIDSNLPQFDQHKPRSLEDAFQKIGCDQYADDANVVRIFQERVNKELNVNFQELWNCLKVISDTRSSKLIEGFLSSGIIDSRLLSADKSPAGLNNIGNTCYLNSLLQYYFVIEPLRSVILAFNNSLESDFMDSNENFTVRRIGGRTVGQKETERSYQFMYQLRDLYTKMIHANERCVEPTRELAYLAFSPISDEVEFDNDEEEADGNDDEKPSNTSTRSDTDGDTAMKYHSEDKENESASLETPSDVMDVDNTVDNTVDNIAVEEDNVYDEELRDAEPIQHDSSSSKFTTPSSTPSPVLVHPPEIKTAATAKISADQIENALEIGRQQDVTECIENVLIQIESALEPEELDTDNEQLDLIKELFYGKTKQVLMPVDPITKEEIDVTKARTKEERFLNLIVNIGDHPKDIYDALDTFFTEDLLTLDNEEVKRSLTITQLPNILQIQIQRVQFDRERLIPVKSIEPLPFKENLYMDRYMETTDSELISKRKEVFHWKHRIASLTERKNQILKRDEKGLTIKEVLEGTRQYLKSSIINDIGLLIDSNTLVVLDKQIERIENELRSITQEIESLQTKISLQFNDLNKIGYSIFAIFIHRGQASYGHYWIYIKDPKSNLYRKYNDEVVSEVTVDEVLNFSENNNATPYYLVFVKDELIDSIEPLKREITDESI